MIARTLAQETRRLIFVRKRWSGAAGWSDAIQKFYEAAAERFTDASLLEVDVNGLTALREANCELALRASHGGQNSRLVIMVNHSICWWALAPTLMHLKRAGHTVVLCMHEHEQILGMRFVVRNRFAFGWKEALRYARLYHRIPARACSRVLVLAEAQAAVLGLCDAIRCSYLPVDGTAFPPDLEPMRLPDALPVILFAHDPARFDKGHRYVGPTRALMRQPVDWAYGRKSNLPFDQVYQKYWNADVLFLPSDWESYSLVFIEALACNKFIVCSPHVGALKLLQAKYSLEVLETFGVCVTDHDERAYADTLDRVARQVSAGACPRTRELFDEFQFNSVQLPLELL